jgi:hypothetical protein
MIPPEPAEQLFHPLFFLSPIIVIMKKAIHSKSISCGTHAPIAAHQPLFPHFHGQMFIHWTSYSMPLQDYTVKHFPPPPSLLVKFFGSMDPLNFYFVMADTRNVCHVLMDQQHAKKERRNFKADVSFSHNSTFSVDFGRLNIQMRF